MSGDGETGTHAVLFDWDGTLLRSIETLISACRTTTAGLIGQSFPTTSAEEAILLQAGEGEAIRMLTDDPQLHMQLSDEFRAHYRRRAAEEAPLYDGVLELLVGLRDREWQVGVVSNGELERVSQDAERLGLMSLVTAFVTYSDVASWVPHPAAVRLGLERLSSEPAESIFVGDSPADITAGRAAGTRTAAAVYGYEGSRAGEEQPDFRLKRPCELLLVIDELARIKDGR